MHPTGGSLFDFLPNGGGARLLDMRLLFLNVSDGARYRSSKCLEVLFAKGGGWPEYKKFLEKSQSLTALLCTEIVEKYL